MTTPPRTDAALVGAARDGCGDAFAELYDRHRARVAGVCARRLPAAEVDDVVQEAFVRAWQRLDDLDEPSCFGPWVRSIAVRAAADHVRTHRRTYAAPGGVAARVAEDEATEVEERLDRRARARRVVASLPELGPRDRRALWLRDALGAPIPDVASELGLTEASTRVMLTRARRRLRDAVGAIAVWLGALAGRRSAPGAASAPVPVAVALGVTLMVGVVGPAHHGAPPTAPPPDGIVDAGSPVGATSPGLAAGGPAGARALRVVAYVDRLHTWTPMPTAPVTAAAPPADDPEPVVAPRVEQRPVRAEDPERDVAVSSPDGFAAVGVYVGDELDRLPPVEGGTDLPGALADARRTVGRLIGDR